MATTRTHHSARRPPRPAVTPPWKPCEEHGIALSQCWACSKPAGLCSYGLCGEPATHLTSGNRRCCEADARFLAQINGGTVTAISAEGAPR
jgi:hypothetical protein